jgi:hypothetical protein
MAGGHHGGMQATNIRRLLAATWADPRGRRWLVLSQLALVGQVVFDLLIPQAIRNLVNNGILAGDIDSVVNGALWMAVFAVAERRPSSTDRRARIIAVTPAGRRMVDDGLRITGRVYDDVLSTLTAREREGFVRALERLAGEGGRLSTPVPGAPAVRRRTPRAGGRSAVA